MLVLSRKKGEAICLGNEIKIVVVELRGDKVRIGIEAPKEMPVHRHEVYEQIHGTQPTKPADVPYSQWSKLDNQQKLAMIRGNVMEGDTD